jgi:hypothetical protein
MLIWTMNNFLKFKIDNSKSHIETILYNSNLKMKKKNIQNQVFLLMTIMIQKISKTNIFPQNVRPMQSFVEERKNFIKN